MQDNLAQKKEQTSPPFTPLGAPQGSHSSEASAYSYAPEDLHLLARRYRRNRLIAFIAPLATLFGTTTLWGIFALLGGIAGTDGGMLGTLASVFSLLVPILIALSVVGIPIGIFAGVIYSNKLNRLPTIAGHNIVPSQDTLVGISGWLILVAIGLVATVAFQAFNAIQSIAMFQDGTVALLNDPASSPHIPGFGGYMLVTLFIEIALIIYAGYLLKLMFDYRRIFPRRYLAFIVALVPLAILDVLYMASIDTAAFGPEMVAAQEEGYTTLGRAMIGAIVWGTYMRVS